MTRRLSEDIVERWRAIVGGTVGDGAFASGPAVWVGKRGVAHIDVDGSIDIRLTGPNGTAGGYNGTSAQSRA